LKERLSILNDLNFVFQANPEIAKRSSYWYLIKEGLVNCDDANRKLSLEVVKGNLKMITDPQASFGVEKSEFEAMWTTFFDVFDTLESFGSHLTKAIWHRVELFYEYITKNDELYTRHDSKEEFSIPHLADFRSWLLVIYDRVASHSNLKIRRFIQKKTLTRTYITVHMAEYFMGEF
jgi:hypothetical protein